MRVEAGTGPYANIGVRIVAVEPQGGGARAGLRVADMLLAVDHRPLRDPEAVENLVFNAGRPVEVVAVRDGSVWTASVTPGASAAPPVKSGVRDLLDRLIPK